MAGYRGITAGYLIRSSRPCLVYIPETGDLRPATPPPDFDLSVALASIGKFAALGPSRLLFSHYGPVSDVSATLERSAEEISVWVSETRAARAAGMDLDHAVEAVRQKTLSRYAALGADADPAVTEKFGRISGTEANVGGIWHWLDKLDGDGPRRLLVGGRGLGGLFVVFVVFEVVLGVVR